MGRTRALPPADFSPHEREEDDAGGPELGNAYQHIMSSSTEEVGTNHLDAFQEQVRVRVDAGHDLHRLAVRAHDGVRVREHDPDGVERDREEVPEEHRGRGYDAACLVSRMVRGRSYGWTYPARSETGPSTQSPPRSKYLKQPTRRTSRDSSGRRCQ